MNKLTRPLSPFSYYQYFNKIAADQITNEYIEAPSSEFSCKNLRFQPLEQYKIPEPFVQKHIQKNCKNGDARKENYKLGSFDAYSLIKVVDDAQSNGREEIQNPMFHKQNLKRAQHRLLEKNMENKMEQFKILEAVIEENKESHKKVVRRTVSVNNFGNNENVVHNIDSQKDHFINRLVRKLPIDKLEEIQRLCDNDRELLQSKDVKNSQKNIQPKYNQNILLPHLDFGCRTKKEIINGAKKKKEYLSKPQVQNSTQKADILQKQLTSTKWQSCAIKNQSNKSESSGNFFQQQSYQNDIIKELRMKNPQQVQQILKLIKDQNPQTQTSENEGGKISQKTEKINENLKKQFQQKIDNFANSEVPIETNDNFLNFQKYFYKNYQNKNNGVGATLPNKLIQKYQDFENMIYHMMENQDPDEQ